MPKKLAKKGSEKRPKKSNEVSSKRRAIIAPFSLNPALMKCAESLAEKWKANEDCVISIKEDGTINMEHGPNQDDECSPKQIQLTNFPFKHCVVNNFITGEEFLPDLCDELRDLNYTQQNSDLFQFHQSDAFDSIDLPHVSAVKKLLYQDMQKWLTVVTNEPLTDKCDTFCSRYEHTDYLLCHDDRSSTRKIAFIYYLNKNWKENDGGTLDLFNADEKDEPKDLVSTILPNWNSFIFFDVSKISHHQVSEVLNQDKIRVAISGWYHVPAVPEFVKPLQVLPPVVGQPASDSIKHIREYLNPDYFDDEYVSSIQKHFEETSEVQLHNIFLPEQHELLCEALMEHTIKWDISGPPNRRHYQIAQCDSLPECVQECLAALRSGPMFKFLSRLTDLEFDRVDETDGALPVCSAEVQQWSQGCYTLLGSPSSNEPIGDVLDVYFHFNSETLQDDENVDVGGDICYLEHNAGKKRSRELLRLSPVPNSMSLVYAQKGVDKIVKYLNSQYKFAFQTIQLEYNTMKASPEEPASPQSTETDSSSDSSTP